MRLPINVRLHWHTYMGFKLFLAGIKEVKNIYNHKFCDNKSSSKRGIYRPPLAIFLEGKPKMWGKLIQ